MFLIETKKLNPGKDAFIYIPLSSEEQSEVIPVYTHLTDDFYRKDEVEPWVTGSAQEITFID